MGMIKLNERRVSPEIMVEPTPAAAAAAADLDSSSKEESFQDSRAYLASDSEDDYYSVKGTPSVASSRPGTPQRRRICIKNIFYRSMLERSKIHMIPPPPPTTTRATTIGHVEAPAPPAREQKPLIEFFTDPYWIEEISTDGDVSGGAHPTITTTTSKQLKLVEFLQDSFWKKEFFLAPSPHSRKAAAAASSSPVPGGAVVVTGLKSGNKRVQNDGSSSKSANDDHDQRHGSSCCFPSFAPRFWSKKRKTKVAP
ncbi:unnamed protein product [Linum tenue]|uniref:Uncharacterized protein n=1 Tax=Linum tenue TaxID=586396 RepID=A0AAV0MK70_9ROSI|nr:unnamed protein product [Linum tenue]